MRHALDALGTWNLLSGAGVKGHILGASTITKIIVPAYLRSVRQECLLLNLIDARIREFMRVHFGPPTTWVAIAVVGDGFEYFGGTTWAENTGRELLEGPSENSEVCLNMILVVTQRPCIKPGVS